MLNDREVARFCRQLGTLLHSGLAILEALRIIKNISQFKKRHSALNFIIQQVSEGQPLSFALEDVLPPLAISSIKGAEKSGNLDEVLEKLGKYFEGKAELAEKIKSALIYPLFVLSLSLISFLVLFLVVLPSFKSLFLDLGANLPFLTWFLINISDFIFRMWYWAVLVLAASLLLFFSLVRKKNNRQVFDKIVLQTPIIGPFVKKGLIIQNFAALGSLLEGGTPIREALEVVINSSHNEIFKKAFGEIKTAVENGEKLSFAFGRYNLFPPEAIQMVGVGENSGRVGEMLLQIAKFYEKENENFLKRFTTLLEPALTLVVGLVVGLIAWSVVLPLISMVQALQ